MRQSQRLGRHWSPDGNLLLLSFRSAVLRAQHLVSERKRPLGKPFTVAHFHSSRVDLRNVGVGMLEIGIARDKPSSALVSFEEISGASGASGESGREPFVKRCTPKKRILVGITSR